MLEQMRIYHQGYSTEILWIQAYRILCLMVEALLFASAFGLIQIYKEGQVNSCWMGILLALGLFVIFVWITVCELRTKRAEEWREKILELRDRSLSNAEAQFLQCCERDWAVSLGRWTFNLVIPLLLIPVWVVIFWIAVCG